MTPYRAAFIGAGRIVAGFDAPRDDHVLTHCHAIHGNPRVELAGVFDSHAPTLQAAARKWGFRGVASFDDLLETRADIYLIAAPDEQHEAYLRTLLDAGPRLVVCEKPMTTSVEATESVVAAYEAKGIRLAVGYQRRFDADVNHVRSRYRSGELGRFISGHVAYSKGILHNGSHAVDTLRYLFGDVLEHRGFGVRDDFTPEDPSVAALLRFADGEVFMSIGDEHAFSIFEIDLLFERGRWRFVDSGMAVEVARVEADPMFEGYRSLVVAERRPSTLPLALKRMWDSMLDALDSGQPMANSGAEALATQRVCASLAAGARRT
jgi:predicted dehydrogenase